MSRAVQQAIGLVRVLVECERPALREIVAAIGESIVRADPRQARPLQIHQPQRATLKNLAKRPGRYACQCESSSTELAAETLDECTVDAFCDVEDTILIGRGVEAIEAGPAEVDRSMVCLLYTSDAADE